jgi:chorismate-pyruvate lyase
MNGRGTLPSLARPFPTAHVMRAGPVGADAIETVPVELDPFDRMLLTADGTVTTLLEACAGEPIVTRTMRQSGAATLDRLRAASGCWWQPDPRLLHLAPAERLMARRVTLNGSRSGAVYVLAESLVVPDRLPDWFADRLLHAGASLGRLLAAVSWRPVARSIRSSPGGPEKPPTTSMSGPAQRCSAGPTRS